MLTTYYWEDVPNFGDRLGLYLLRRFVTNDVGRDLLVYADVITTGSILEHVPEGWSGIVAGAGRLVEDSPVHLESANVLALRGPLSARGIPGDYALGDPGLLADELVDVWTRDIDLGILPHWTDTDLKYRHEFQPYNPYFISPFMDPISVILEIGRCKKLVTSSLHGLIIADAFGIPRRFEVSPRLLPNEGGLFKIRDYHASIGMSFEVGVTKQADRNRVEDRKHELWDVFQEVRQLLT